MSCFFEWLKFKAHEYKDSLEDDEMFVLPGAILSEHVESNSLYISYRVLCVLSTRALLRNALVGLAQQDSSQATFLSMDGTYNLLANPLHLGLLPEITFSTILVFHLLHMKMATHLYPL